MAVLNAILYEDENDGSGAGKDLAKYFTPPPMLTRLQVKQITSHLAEWVQAIPKHMSALIKKQLLPLLRGRWLRPIWCCPSPDGSIEWTDSVYADEYLSDVSPAAVSNLPFVPIILLSVSVVDKDGDAGMREFQSWSYVQGAGDDEEHWAPKGFTSELFWAHKDFVLSSDDSVEVNKNALEVIEQHVLPQPPPSTGHDATHNRPLNAIEVVPGLWFARTPSSCHAISAEEADQYCRVLAINTTIATDVGSADSDLRIKYIETNGAAARDRDQVVHDWIKGALICCAGVFAAVTTSAATAAPSSSSLINRQPSILIVVQNAAVDDEFCELGVMILASIITAFYGGVYRDDVAGLSTLRVNECMVQSILDAEEASASVVSIPTAPQQQRLSITKQDIKLVLLWLQLHLHTLEGYEQICTRQSMKDIFAFFVCPQVAADGSSVHWWTSLPNC
jgi:hypothetical protein